jgi:hypothetical protein
VTIETKFDLGQNVWTISQTYMQCECCGHSKPKAWKLDTGGPTTISSVNATVRTSGYNRIEYDTGYRFDIDEEYCFATKEEAQAECDRRNAEIKAKEEV